MRVALGAGARLPRTEEPRRELFDLRRVFRRRQVSTRGRRISLPSLTDGRQRRQLISDDAATPVHAEVETIATARRPHARRRFDAYIPFTKLMTFSDDVLHTVKSVCLFPYT